jgi:hypothetical protein
MLEAARSNLLHNPLDLALFKCPHDPSLRIDPSLTVNQFSGA